MVSRIYRSVTHEPEFDFVDYVEEWFRHRYGAENVEREHYQPMPNWYCDLRVDTGYATLYIEVENDSGSIRSGIAQALGYAAEDQTAGVPMVVTPRGHINNEKIERLRQSSTVVVREFDAEDGEFVY